MFKIILATSGSILSFSAPAPTLASVSVRGRNLTNASDGEYPGYPMSKVYIGAPRSGAFALFTHF